MAFEDLSYLKARAPEREEVRGEKEKEKARSSICWLIPQMSPTAGVGCTDPWSQDLYLCLPKHRNHLSHHSPNP